MQPNGAITPLSLRTEDGVRIDACHRAAANGAADLAIVVAHGFTGSWRRVPQSRIASALAATAGVVGFDFRGHGRSGGHSTVGDREILDVQAAAQHARGLGYQRVATVGFSMGASVVIRHAGLIGGVNAVAAVSGPGRWYFRGTPRMRTVHWVVEQPVGRLVGRLALRTRIASARWDPVPEQPTIAAARISPTPLLVVHGDRDPYFPVGHAHALHDAARPPKQLWIESGYGHAESAANPDLIARIGRWLREAATDGAGTG
ncbi:MAG: alpha/beta fold hydrolase [Micromonosporaceae bacterium]|nr:alpha/beta fold hydrolase [Micromonosporaceae bacterium]